MATVTNRRMI